MGPPGFLEVYQRATRPVYQFLLSMTNDPFLAEDLHQDTFVRLLAPDHWSKVRQLHPDQQRVWLFRTAYHIFIDGRRREMRMGWTPVPDEALATVEWAVQVDKRIDAERILCRLPLQDRAILYLRFVADLRPIEIGAILGMPARAVSRHEYRAKQRARRLIAEAGKEA